MLRELNTTTSGVAKNELLQVTTIGFRVDVRYTIVEEEYRQLHGTLSANTRTSSSNIYTQTALTLPNRGVPDSFFPIVTTGSVDQRIFAGNVCSRWFTAAVLEVKLSSEW